MTILESLNKTLSINPNSCIQVGKYLIDKYDNLEFIIYKDTFDFIVKILIVRYIIYLIMFIMKKFKVKPFKVKFPKNFFEYFKKGKYTKFEMVNVLEWVHDLMIVIIELRLLALVQIFFM